MAADDRPGHEVGAGKAAVALGLMEIGKRTVGAGLVEPLGDAFQDLGTDGFRRDGRGEELPVGFRVEVAAVEGQAVLLADGVVPLGLDFVNVGGDEAGALRAAGVVAWFQGLLVIVVLCGAGGWRKRCSLEVEAE